VTVSAGTSQETDGMGQTVGDFNNDGLFDWYATSIDGGPGCSGNKLYYNLGNHVYDEVACEVGVHEGGYGWGAVAVDFNHDGLLDLAETNGGPFFPFVDYPSKLWIQNEEGTFDDMTALSGFIHNGEGRGMINFDYDNDGDQDVAIAAYSEPFTLFRNDLSGPDTNWLKVWLDTSNTDDVAPNGFGAKVSATIGEFTMYRSMTSGSNFESNSAFSAHFGLAGAESVDELVVEWPDGEVTTMTNVAANQSITIVYGESPDVPGDLDGDGDVDFADLLALLAAWGDCFAGPACPEDLDDSGGVGFADLLILLANWT